LRSLRPPSKTSTLLLGWLVLLLLAFLAYRPGLSGGFLFDDFANLPALGSTGPIDDWPTFWRYITSGVADPTGRPLALLSFMLDARDWPADPLPFLRTNLFLHLLNGTLLFALLRKLGAVLDGTSQRNDAAALLAGGLWLLHPLFVSTTLYIVQREAMLPATFVLLGLLAFTHGRAAYRETRGRSGLMWMVLGTVLGTVLATSCKANGILLPMLAWVVEATVFRAGRAAQAWEAADRRLAACKLILLAIPSALVLFYLIRLLPAWDFQPPRRAWTIGERVLTEARVLFDYLRLLLVPRSVSTGLYNDDYPVSSGLLAPALTLAAVLGVLALAAAGFALRRRAPALAAAILFFLAGHLLESSVVPLELYFEHRNYLPALLLFWPLARGVLALRRSPAIRTSIAVGLLAFLALTTYQRAAIWGHPEQLAKLSAARDPGSSRAQATAASIETAAGHPAVAMARLGPLWNQRPHDLMIGLNYINAACAGGSIPPADARRLAQTIRHAEQATLLVRNWLENALAQAVSKRCAGLDLATVKSWILAAGDNPQLNLPTVREKSMSSLFGLVALEEHRPDQALVFFNRSLLANAAPEVAAGQAVEFATRGYYREALLHLDYYDAMDKPVAKPRLAMGYLHELVLERQAYWPRELALLRAKLERELAFAHPGPTSPPVK